MASSGSNQPYAVITGASRGLGQAFATALSKQGFNTILVSLPGENLDRTADLIATRYGTKSVSFETDLTDQKNVIALAQQINQSYSVSILINNAGAGGTQEFIRSHPEEINAIIQLNVTATALMTHQLLPNLMKQPRGYILNVSSICAFSPTGYKTVYPATKIFINSFSHGLSQELKNSTVTVSVVNPGPMDTNKEVTTRIRNQGLIARMGKLPVETVAEMSLKKMFKGKRQIFLNAPNRINHLIMYVIPLRLGVSLSTFIVKREINRANK